MPFKKVRNIVPEFLRTQVKKEIKLFRLRSEFKNFEKKIKNKRFTLDKRDINPQLDDNTEGTPFDRHYIYHPAWAARVLANTKPNLHIDISSTLTFCTLISAFFPVKFIDYRPANLKISNLETGAGDLSNLPFETGSIDSLSCMHVVEHIGLGRYGDPLDPDGDLKAVSELKRVLAKGGSLLFVVPIGGISKICFNAHRIYTYKQVMEMFKELKLCQFALIPEKQINGELTINATEEMANREEYGCGCFWFQGQ